jgi:aerobic carbon-monoxide dehydrogenase medium subunit
MIHHFRYLAPRTREELYGILADHGPGASLLAGGTDLLVNIRNGVARPGTVVDVKKVAGYGDLAWSDGEGLSIGASVTVNDLLRDAGVRSRFPILAAAAHDLASYQVRNRATAVGNVVNASPCSDLAPALLCLQASAVIGGRQGERVVPFKEFFTGVKRTVLAPGEILERILVPAASAGARGDYHKLKRIQGHDLAIVGVALLKQDGVVRVGVSSAAPTPVLVEGLREDDAPEAVAAAVLKAICPISDVRCTKEYREHMVQVFVRRLLQEVK